MRTMDHIIEFILATFLQQLVIHLHCTVMNAVNYSFDPAQSISAITV